MGQTNFSRGYKRQSYSARCSRVIVVLSNAEYSGGSVNCENFATKVHLNGKSGRERDGEKARGNRGKEEAVKDGEGDASELGISASTVRLHTSSGSVGSRAPAASSSTDRGIPLRDARINRFPASL